MKLKQEEHIDIDQFVSGLLSRRKYMSLWIDAIHMNYSLERDHPEKMVPFLLHFLLRNEHNGREEPVKQAILTSLDLLKRILNDSSSAD